MRRDGRGAAARLSRGLPRSRNCGAGVTAAKMAAARILSIPSRFHLRRTARIVANSRRGPPGRPLLTRGDGGSDCAIAATCRAAVAVKHLTTSGGLSLLRYVARGLIATVWSRPIVRCLRPVRLIGDRRPSCTVLA